MDQRGLAIIPIILWTVISASGLVIFSTATEVGYNLVTKNLKETVQSQLSNHDIIGNVQPAQTPYVNTTLSPIPKAIPQVKPQQVVVNQPTPISTPIPTPNLDPMVTCLIHKNCGGGSIQLRSSICSNSTCCQIGDKWIFYQSKSKCTQDQSIRRPNTTLQNNTSSYTGEPIIECVLSYGTYQLFKSYCGQAKIEDQNTQAALRKIEEERRRLNQELAGQVASQQTSSDALNERCKSAYDINVINANQFSAGLREFTLQQAQADYQRCLQGGSSEPLKITRPSPTPTPNYEGTQVYPWVPQY